jgi:hypothetical protein
MPTGAPRSPPSRRGRASDSSKSSAPRVCFSSSSVARAGEVLLGTAASVVRAGAADVPVDAASVLAVVATPPWTWPSGGGSRDGPLVAARRAQGAGCPCRGTDEANRRRLIRGRGAGVDRDRADRTRRGRSPGRPLRVSGARRRRRPSLCSGQERGRCARAGGLGLHDAWKHRPQPAFDQLGMHRGLPGGGPMKLALAIAAASTVWAGKAALSFPRAHVEAFLDHRFGAHAPRSGASS